MWDLPGSGTEPLCPALAGGFFITESPEKPTCIFLNYGFLRVFSQDVLVAQTVKNLPEMQEIWVWSLDWEDPLENGKATRSSILVLPLSFLTCHSHYLPIKELQDQVQAADGIVLKFKMLKIVIPA